MMNPRPIPMSRPRKPVAVIHYVAHERAQSPVIDIAAAVGGRTIFVATEPLHDGESVNRVLLKSLKAVWKYQEGGMLVYGLPHELRELVKVDPDYTGIEFPSVVQGPIKRTWDACRSSFGLAQEVFFGASEEVEQPELPAHVTIATDASKQKSCNVVGIAAVSAGGQMKTSSITASKILEGEFAAIALAFTHLSRAQSVEVLTDSQHAAKALNYVLGGASTRRPGAGPEEIKCLHAMDKLRRRGVNVRVRWVRGHDGHELNELAHRSAVTARRNAQWELEDCPQLDNLREELHALVAS